MTKEQFIEWVEIEIEKSTKSLTYLRQNTTAYLMCNERKLTLQQVLEKAKQL